MARYPATKGLREIINEKKAVAIGVAILMILGAGLYLIHEPQPAPRPSGDKAFYTIDDGKTWFIDSIYKTPPFDREGKIAVRALIYSYSNGRKQFCPIVERYSSETKKMLDDAIVAAEREGKPLSSIPLFNFQKLVDGMEIKPSGSEQEWISRSDKEASAIILTSIKAPDGSTVDFVIP